MENHEMKSRSGMPESNGRPDGNGNGGPEPSRDYTAYAVLGVALLILIVSGIFAASHLMKGSAFVSEKEISGWVEDLEKQGRDLLNRFSGRDVSRQSPAQEAERHLQKGQRLTSKSRLKEAMEEFEKAVRLNPKNPEALYWKGRVLIRLQRYDEAFESFQNAVGLNPNYREAHDNLAWLHEMNKNYDQALSHLNKSLQLSRDNSWAHFHRARILHAQGETEKALEDARRACELKSQDGCRLYEEYKAKQNRPDRS